ncbi:MAG: asparagine synthase [Bdellovibrionaceae bacterium]|nr:asparagine synthase [Pseudobdellovibrionaceae bacterium]
MIKEIQFDQLSEPMVLSRGTFAIKPCYYIQDSKKIIVSDQLKELALCLKNLTINWDYFKKLWNNDYILKDQTPYGEIKTIPANTELYIFNDGRIEFKDLGIILANQNSNSCEYILDKLEFHILENLKELEKQKSALFLSGGLDSTLLFAMIQRHKLNIPAVHLDFQQAPEKDTGASDHLEQFFKNKFHKVRADRDSFTQKQPWYTEGELAIWTLNFDLFTPLYKWAQQQACKTVFTGTGGDDLFTLNSSYLLPLLKQEAARLERLKYIYNYIKYFKKEGIPSLVSQILPLELKKNLKSFFNKPTLYDDFFMAHKNHMFLEKMMNWRMIYSGIYSFVFTQEQERASTFGLKMAYPLISEEIFKTIISAPLKLHTQFPIDKPLLRSLAQRYLPKEIAYYLSQQDYTKLIAMQKKNILISTLTKINFEKWPLPFSDLHLNKSMITSNLDNDQMIKLLYINNFEEQTWLKTQKKQNLTISPSLKNMEM